MKLKIFTLKFSETVDGFDDSAIQDFQAEREIIEVTEHFFVHEQTPYLTVLLSYRNISADEIRKPVTKRRSDPRADLDEEEKITYDALRSWRAAKAKQEGIPPYVIANNKQLAKMIKLRADNKTALLKVDGFGEAKTEQYGTEILEMLKAQTDSEKDTSQAAPTDTESSKP